MSGAGREKGDMKVNGAYVEHKLRHKSYTLQAAEAEQWWKQAMAQGDDECTVIVTFSNPRMRCTMKVEPWQP